MSDYANVQLLTFDVFCVYCQHKSEIFRYDNSTYYQFAMVFTAHFKIRLWKKPVVFFKC